MADETCGPLKPAAGCSELVRSCAECGISNNEKANCFRPGWYACRKQSVS